VRLPGSTRVISCSPCQGVGRLPCPRCKGGGRVVVARSSPGAGASGRGARRAAATTVSGGVKAAAAPAAGAAGGQAEALTAGATALVPCPDCQGTGGLKCEQCDGVGRLMQHKTVKWQRRATELKDNDDLPRVDEQWLHRVCKARDVYRERQQGGFRPEWSLVPGLDELVKSAEKRLDQNTRVAMSEVSIAFIPVTEIVFDLGDVRQKPSLKPAAQRGQSPPAADAGLYRWHIYGFERRLPKDWRFLNWDRVAALILAGVVEAAAMVLSALAPDLLVLGAATVVSGMAWTVFILARQGFLIAVAPVAMRARAMSTLGGSHRIGAFVGPLAGAGVLALTDDLRSVFWLAAAMAVLAAAVVWWAPDLPAQVEGRPGRRPGGAGRRPASSSRWRCQPAQPPARQPLAR